MERIDAVVVGAGQAGLVTSYELTARGIDHVVLERGRIGDSWARRWDSFTLVSPAWWTNLPGRPRDEEGTAKGEAFLPRDEIVAMFEDYARGFDAPIREAVEVRRLRPVDEGFVVETSEGDLSARAAVVATGSFRRPFRPPGSEDLPAGLPQIDADHYRNSDGLPDGKLLILGGAQTACQIAEDLVAAGREVVVATGRVFSGPRRIGDHDLFWWIVETGFAEQPVEALDSPLARLFANPIATGRDGGHDLSLFTLREAGVEILGRFVGADGSAAAFADDVPASLASGEEFLMKFRGMIERTANEKGIPQPDLPPPAVWTTPTRTSLDLTGFGAVVHASGFRPDYGSWIEVAGGFDEHGFPVQRDGASLAADGLYFVGTHFLRKRKSSLLWGVGEDAAIVAGALATRLGAAAR